MSPSNARTVGCTEHRDPLSEKALGFVKSDFNPVLHGSPVVVKSKDPYSLDSGMDCIVVFILNVCFVVRCISE